jgi:CPA2 family monovalent cation:H+ antiporter-2
MHLAALIRDLAIILGVAGLMSLLFHRIRQPVVLGYILAGIVVGPHTPPFHLISDVPSIQTWAELGVIFLMFSLGLEFSFRKLARVGGAAIITAGMEVLFFLPVGYLVGRLFTWSTMDSIFLGAMLSISSTTIIVKALDELKLKKHRFAELIFAVLIVEDLIAILLLVALSTVAVSKTVSAMALLTAALKLVLVVGGWFITGYFIIPRFMKYVGKSGNDEMLTILSLGLCLALVVFANYFHYSTALGAFIMGSILAESPVLHRIERNMASLRDLFGAVFFVSIGMLIDPRVLWNHKGAVAFLCLVTIVGKIVSTGLGALVSGQSLRNSVQVGFGLAQIGEFSFIIAALGVSLKVTSEIIYPIAVAVSLVTTFTTPYLIRISGRFAAVLEANLPCEILDTLNRYAALIEAKRMAAVGKKGIIRPLFRWLINGLTASVIFVLCSEVFLSYLQEAFHLSAGTAPLVGWGIAILLSSPFIWAMFTTFRSSEPNRANVRFLVSPVFRVLSKILAVVWVSALSAEFFPRRYVVAVTIALLLGGFLLFYRRLEKSYHWFERRFLSTFELVPKSKQESVPFSHLAPWDAHLVSMEIHPNASLVSKRISDAALRVRYGVNIVAIQRGQKAIVTPMPNEVLLPNDALILLGTDEQVESLRKELEAPDELARESVPSLNYEVRQARLSDQSPFVEQTIRQSGMREKFYVMVVGIERCGVRTINPDSDLQLASGDILWIAGESGKLTQLLAVINHPGFDFTLCKRAGAS